MHDLNLLSPKRMIITKLSPPCMRCGHRHSKKRLCGYCKCQRLIFPPRELVKNAEKLAHFAAKKNALKEQKIADQKKKSKGIFGFLF